MKIRGMGLIQRALIGLDQFANSMLGGDPDMTLSTRMGIAMRANKAKWYVKAICWFLDKLDKKHCEEAKE